MGLVSTWMGDRLGTPGVVGFLLFMLYVLYCLFGIDATVLHRVHVVKVEGPQTLRMELVSSSYVRTVFH